MKSRITLFLFPSLLFCSSLFGQLNYKWSQGLGSAKSDFTGWTMADEEDNLYSLYQFADTVDLDPGPGISLVTPASTRVIVLYKSDAEGNFQWGGQFHSVNTLAGNLLEVTDNQISVAINFVDSLQYLLNGQTLLAHQAPGRNTCLLTISPAGAILEVTYMPSANGMNIGDLHTLSTGHIFLSGSFKDTLSFPGAPMLISIGKYDPFFMLIDANKDVIWATSFGSEQDDYASEIKPFTDSTFYFSLYHKDTVVLHTTSGLNTFAANGEAHSIILAINLQGQVEHAFSITSEARYAVEDLVIDKDENIYVGGYYEGAINFAHATQTPEWHTSVAADDGFVARYTKDGLLDWVNVYISSEYSYIIELVLERDTDLYVGGGAAGITDLDPGPDSLITNNNSNADLFIAKLQLDGTQSYAYSFESNRGSSLTTMVVSDSRSEVILSGFFSDSMDCDFTAEEQLLVSAGGSDLFRIVFDEENVVTAIENPAVADNSRVYPNPATDYVRIESDEPIDFISIHAINGQQIHSVDFEKRLSAEIDLTELSPGLYCITLHSQNKVVTKRIVKQ
jgi:hypothetical protein